MSRSARISALLLAIAACKGGSSSGTDAGGAACKSSVPATSASCQLKDTASLPGGRTGGAAFVDGNDVIVVGGVGQGGTPVMEINALASGGSSWSTVGTVPQGRPSAAYVMHDHRLFMFGGETRVANGMEDGSPEVYVSTRSGDGSFPAFQSIAPLPSMRTRMAAAAGSKAVYLLGGQSARAANPDALVYVAKFDDQGGIASFESSAPLPQARSQASAVVVGSRLYVVGGLFDGNDKSCAKDTVIFAPINDDGSLGAFSSTTSLPRPPSGAAVAVSGSTIYIVGGTSGFGDTVGGYSVGSVLSATVGDDGHLSQWKRVGFLKDDRYGHAAAVLDSRLFVAGGTFNNGMLGDVVTASFAADGSANCQ